LEKVNTILATGGLMAMNPIVKSVKKNNKLKKTNPHKQTRKKKHLAILGMVKP